MGFRIDAQLTVAPGEVAATAERLRGLGFDGVFTFEGPADVFLPLTLAASAGLDLMTNIAVAFPRSPVHLAHTAHDLHLLSGGRFRLGLGSQVRAHVERRYGAAFDRPAARMREYVLAIKAIQHSWQTGEPLDFRGEFTTHTLMPPLFSPGPNPHGTPPVLVAGVGPLMTAVAGEVADGYLIHPFNSPASVETTTLPALDKGLATAGRSRSDLEICHQFIVGTGRDEAEVASAREAARTMIAFYGSTAAYLPVLEAEGAAELHPALRALTRENRWGDLPGLIPDELLDRIAVTGSPDQVAAAIRARATGLADRIALCTPHVPSPEALTTLLDALH
ncbi:TIGR03617 family F420-dependent LLM class oxidoreductase [Actinocorallia longicatena]|uniref:LLM class F420-dependent oxidoreductase n=1 Tax=Actinocorallia longicatena TaxID=111803 RepID=A0ABP6QM53_9ACTN